MNTINEQLTTVQDIIDVIRQSIGKTIRIMETNKQGRIISEYIGELTGAYAYFFVIKIKVKQTYINKSFSYVDFFTKALKYEIL